MDCQGTGDNLKSDTSLDTLIMLLSLQLSSVQVLNVRGYLTSHDISSLQACAESAKLKLVQEGELRALPVFKSLIVAIRDYGGDEHGKDDDLLHNTIMKAPNTNGNTVAIDKAFHSIRVYNFPYPGKQVAFASAETGEWSPSVVPEDFCKVAKTLFHTLCVTEPGKEQCWPSAREIIAHFKEQKKWLGTEYLPQTKSSSEALKDGLLFKEFEAKQKALASIQKELKSSEELHSIESDEQLKEKYEHQVSQVIEAFARSGQGKNKDESVMKYVERLQSISHSLYSELRSEFELFKAKEKQQADQKEHQNHPTAETTENH